jgi:hypothetical protein
MLELLIIVMIEMTAGFYKSFTYGVWLCTLRSIYNAPKLVQYTSHLAHVVHVLLRFGVSCDVSLVSGGAICALL